MKGGSYFVAAFAACFMGGVAAQNSAAAHAKVVFTCESKRAVGYSASYREPSVFTNSSRFRIEEKVNPIGKTLWTVRVLDGEWTFIGMEEPSEETPMFQTGHGVYGRLFVWNRSTGDFSYTDSLGYLQNNSGSTPHMVIGKCRAVTA